MQDDRQAHPFDTYHMSITTFLKKGSHSLNKVGERTHKEEVDKRLSVNISRIPSQRLKASRHIMINEKISSAEAAFSESNSLRPRKIILFGAKMFSTS